MTITGQSQASLLDSVLNAEKARTDMDVTVLKKAQDQMKQQGRAMVEMLEESVTSPDDRRLDTYA